MKRGPLDAWLHRIPASQPIPALSPSAKTDLTCDQSPPPVPSPSDSGLSLPGKLAEIDSETQLPEQLSEPSQLKPSESESKIFPSSQIFLQNIRIADKPKPDYRKIPNEELGRLIYITDFVWSFRTILKMPAFTVPELRTALLDQEKNRIVEGVVRALVREATFELLSRGGEDEGHEFSPRLRLLGQFRAYFDLTFLCSQVYFSLASELLSLHDSESDPDPLIEKLRNCPVIQDSFFSSFDYREKTEIVIRLIDSVMEGESIHEVLALRMEEKKSLVQKKTEVTAQLRAFNKEHRGQTLSSSSPELLQKQRLKLEISKLTSAIRSIPLRTEPLGTDRAFNRYFRFGFDPTRIFVEKRMREPQETGFEEFWFCYQSKDLQRKLVRALKHETETQLKEGLEKIIEEIADQDENLEDSMDVEETKVDLKTESRLKMLELETRITTFFAGTQKSWEDEDQIQVWRTKVSMEETADGLKTLLSELEKKSESPVKRTAGTCRKVCVRLWKDFPEAREAWANLCEVSHTFSDLFLLVSALAAAVDVYLVKKKNGVPPQTALGQDLEVLPNSR